MDSDKTPYQFCATEAELETLIDGILFCFNNDLISIVIEINTFHAKLLTFSCVFLAKLGATYNKPGHIDLSSFRMTLPSIIESNKPDNVCTINMT